MSLIHEQLEESNIPYKIDIVDYRNEITHTYDSNKAQIIFENIEQSYASTLRIILESIK